MPGSLRHLRLSPLFACTALLVAFAYSCSQLELIESEYETNHPAFSVSPSFARSSVTTEALDKDDVLQAFVVDPNVRIVCIVLLPSDRPVHIAARPGFDLIRDKSPPESSVPTAS